MMAEDDSLPDLAAKRQKCLDMGKKQHVFTYVFLVNDTHFNKSDTSKLRLRAFWISYSHFF